MRPYRSLLFVPGHKPSWVAKGVAAGADALILDLEDAVPPRDKGAAREHVAASIAELDASPERPGVWVRPNAWDTGLAGLDVQAVVSSGPDGLVLPKISTVADVLRFDTLLEHFEIVGGLPVGGIELIVTLETARAMQDCAQLADASPRVVSLLGATARDADTARALGYTFTSEGLETLYLRSRVVLACRAAGRDHPLCGLWQDIADLDGLLAFARQNRQLGFRGQIVIHPSHVGPVNDVYTPTVDEVEFYRGMVAAFDCAVERGDAAADYDGQHIDHAHARTAREVIASAEGFRRAESLR